MNKGLLLGGLFAVALGTAGIAAAQAPGTPGVAGATPSRQAEDRSVEESARQTQPARQTEAPKPQPSFQRQAEPQRQSEPQRQRERQRQRESPRPSEPSRPSNTGHWDDPGPAWRPQGPAWRDLNARPPVIRPGEDAFRAGPNTYVPREGDRNRDSRRRNGNVYLALPYGVPFDVVPYYPSQLPPEPAPERPSRVADEAPLGFLQLRVQPRSAEVYVDGAYAGTVDDFGGHGARMVPAGPRRVEIVAPGYETLTFDVRVPENDTVTFARELEPAVERVAPAAAAAIPHKMLYVVPQCYIGDRMPLPGDMPAGCRVEDVRVIP